MTLFRKIIKIFTIKNVSCLKMLEIETGWKIITAGRISLNFSGDILLENWHGYI